MGRLCGEIWSLPLIPITKQAEPSWFDARIRQPGQVFLNQNPDKALRSLWSLARDDLRTAYGSICAYTCRWISDDATVDHFLPKSKYPSLAYEWENYRLSCNSVNRAKGAKVGLIDPFLIRPWWFGIALPECDVVLGSQLPSKEVSKAHFTIEALKLNSEDLVESRYHTLIEFRDGGVTLDHLRRHYPFYAMEIERQGSAVGASGEMELRHFLKRIFRKPSTK